MIYLHDFVFLVIPLLEPEIINLLSNEESVGGGDSDLSDSYVSSTLVN